MHRLIEQLRQNLLPADMAMPAPIFAANMPLPIRSQQDDLLLKHSALTPAAVLVPIIMRESGAYIVLTKRTAHLSVHAGQVAFPGGKPHANDEHLQATALREAYEEIGLHPHEADILGALPSFATGTGYWVTPFVGAISRVAPWQPNDGEVALVFELPMDIVRIPSNIRYETRFMAHQNRETYVVLHETHDIWGATAYILYMLQQKLAII